jgi:transcriptional regulator with XRE-family HTH domain
MQGSLASKLRVLRAQHGDTLAEASRKTGVDRGTLSNLERGVHAPYTPTLTKIARGYGVPVEELLEVPALPGKVGAPESGRPEQGGSAFDLAYEATIQQERVDQQAANRALSSETITQPARFSRHWNEALERLQELPPAELAAALLDAMPGVVRAERLEQELAQARRELAGRGREPSQAALQAMRQAESETLSLERRDD